MAMYCRILYKMEEINMSFFTYKDVYFEEGVKVLEVNLLPEKYCNFDCIFCPIGRSQNKIDEKVLFEDQEQDIKELLKRINENEIEELLDQLNKRRKSSQIINKNKLKDWKLIRDNFDNEYVTNGLMLLLSNPFHYAHIRIGVFDGENKTKLKKDMICEGSIIDQFDEVIEKLLIELEDGYEIRITRDKKYKIPEVAI